MANPKTPSKRSPARGGPLQLTASSGYAIHGLAYLALKDRGTVTFLSEISEHFAIPASYLAKVFQALARAGLVVSYRGARGGYALAKDAAGVSLREVIEIFEGSIRNRCSLLRGPCHLEPLCTVYRRLAEAQKVYLDTLEEHSIRSIAEEFRRLEGRGVATAKRVGKEGS